MAVSLRLPSIIVGARSDVGKPTGVASLCIGHVDHLLAKERRRLEMESPGSHKHLGIAGPAQSFIALRAIGRDFQIVPFLSPADVLHQTID